jgi:hypothetical protein
VQAPAFQRSWPDSVISESGSRVRGNRAIDRFSSPVPGVAAMTAEIAVGPAMALAN